MTGDRIIISGPGVGSGPGFEAFDVAVATRFDVFFVDTFSATPAVYHVDVATGNRQVIASSTIGTGPVIQTPFGIIVRSDGKLVVSDATGDALVLVDPITLDRSILSGTGVGAGPDIFTPIGMTLDGEGDILVTTATNGPTSALFKVDALTGDREIVSSIDIGSGPGPELWSDVVVDSDGRILVTNFDGPSQIRGVLSVDLATGDRETVSTLGTGGGPELFEPWGIGVEVDGQIIVANLAFSPNDGALIRIDPMTGDRTVLSSFGVGSGPELKNPLLLDIVPVPEPSTAFLFITGAMLLVMLRRRKDAAGRS